MFIFYGNFPHKIKYMKNALFLKRTCLFFSIFFHQISFAQLPDGFDVKKAYQEAKDNGIKSQFVEEFVNHQHSLYLKNKSNVHTHNHKSKGPVAIYPSQGNNISNKPHSPNAPQNVYCPNAGFEGNNFTNWTGYFGDVISGAAGALFPIFNQTAVGIINPNGMNAPLSNQNNFHSVMTTPPINNVFPNCIGYDSLACRVIGTQTISEIPFVNPNGGPSSARIGRYSSFSNDVGTKLTYSLVLNPNNKNFTISYALVLNNANHDPWEQPYFNVNVRDQNGNLVPGCSSYAVTINSLVTTPGSASYDPLFKESDVIFATYYRPWSTYAFDFSNYPTITSVTVEFYVGGCSLGGHFGYAYVDAECSQGGAVASFCAGSNTTVLTAPFGYSSYQWTGPGGPVSNVNGGNTATATITPVTAGQVFTCNVTAPNGCASAFQATVSVTTVSITSIGSTPSCPNGNSGTAVVAATGSSNGYIYQWQNSVGAIVGTSQSASGLSPGIYSITASSPLCGSATETVQVGISAPSFYSLPAPYCGSVAWITNTGGSNYKWYTGANPPALILGATSSSLTINSPVNGAQYFLVFTTASGCKDSIKYTLTQSPGGNIYASNIKSICAGNNNSYAVINLQTTAPPVYSYSVTGPSGYSSTLLNTTLLKDSITGLSIGTYSATVFDGQCIYNTTFTVSPFVYSYSLTPQNTSICAAGSASLMVNFGNTTSNVCGLSTSGTCTSPNQITIGNGTNVNSTTSYPAIYSNWYESSRHQILYLASELSAAGVLPGKISSISWNIATINGTTTYPNFSIKMKCTSLTNLGATTTAPFDQVGLTQVYFAPNINITTGWNNYNFTTAYEWDGVSNILIDVCNGVSNGFTSNSSSPYSITPFNSVLYYRDDNINVCFTNNTGTTSPNRPNIKFGNCGGLNPAAFTYSWSPTIGLNPTTTYTTIANPTVTTIYTVEVNPIGQTNCMQAQTSTITVTSAVIPTITPVSTLCTNASAVTLSGFPAGGTWSLTPSTSTVGVFTPSLATVGTNIVTYLYGGAGCAQTATAAISVERFVPATIAGTINPICLPSNTVNLSTALTTSTLGVGVWSGNGVTGNIFNPNVAGSGTQILTYNTNSVPTISLCPATSTIAVQLNSITQPTISAVNPMCTNAPNVSLSASPAGGVWLGSGVSSTGVLSPSLASVGNNTVVYTIGNSTCSATNSITISIEKFVPSTILGTISPLCNTSSTINLSTALTTSTLGVGLWSGNGVSGTIFDPANAVVGINTLTYSTNSIPTVTLCPSSSTINITVNSVVQPTIAPAGPFCDNYPSQQLTASPSGGVWSPAAIGTTMWPAGQFFPNSSSIGNNKVYYTLTNAPCARVDSTLINVIHFVPATIIGALGPYCIYDAATNLQPIAQFAGGTWSGAGVNSSSFTPSSAGVGIHTITYITNPSPLLNCGSTETLSVLVNDKPNANAISDVIAGCNPVLVNYMTTTVNTGNATWDFGDGSIQENGLSVSHLYTFPGTFTATITYTDNVGCIDTTIATTGITVYANPIASFDPSVTETTVVDGQVEFTNQSTVLGNNSYVWNIGDLYISTLENESFLFSNSGQFVVTLSATSFEGCVDDTSLVITVNPDVVLYVPNAFTPGSDELNDVFQIFLPSAGVDFSTFSLLIYNRWGELIYSTNDVNKFWTGAKNNSGPILKQDTYVYKISFKDEKKKQYEKVGHVTLLVK